MINQNLVSNMSEKAFANILSIIVPPVVKMISDTYDISELDATRAFYGSRLYALLQDKSNGVWHFSTLTLFNAYKQERETGSFELPVEG